MFLEKKALLKVWLDWVKACHLLRNGALVCSLASPQHSDPSATLPLSLLLKYNKDCNGYTISVLNWVRANPHLAKKVFVWTNFLSSPTLNKRVVLSETGQSSKAPRTRFVPGKKRKKSTDKRKCIFLVNYLLWSLTEALFLPLRNDKCEGLLRVHSFQCGNFFFKTK